MTDRQRGHRGRRAIGSGLSLLCAVGAAWLAPAPGTIAVLANAHPVTLDAGCEVVYDHGLSAFTATLRNTGSVATSLTLGVIADAGAGYHPTNFGAAVSGNGEAADQFRYAADPIGGRVGPWLVPLPAGAVYRLRIDSARMLSTQSRRPLAMAYQQGSWQVRLVLHASPLAPGRPGAPLPLLQMATGTIEASAIDVPGSCTRVRAGWR